MAQRTAVLIDERDRQLGSTIVPETVSVIRHDEGIFVRTDKGVRLSGGGIGVAFIETEVVERKKLAPL